MNRRILLAIDADISPGTKLALRVASEFLAQSLPQLGLVLVHVIPVPYVSSPIWGKYRIQPTSQQRKQAEDSLYKARTMLQERNVHPERIEVLLRHGIPADEIVKAAKELDVDFIVIGSQGNSFKQKMQRFFAGSTSRRVLQLASCPVMIVPLPQVLHSGNLVAWYKESITHYLDEHPDTLTVFTSVEAAQMFAPPERIVGSKEVNAASIALEQLSCTGLLFCHRVKGELRYMND